MEKIPERIDPAKFTQRVDDPVVASRPTFSGDPVNFLVGFLSIVRSPRRGEVAFDIEDLQWCADVWEQACIVAQGRDPAFIHERDRFRKLCEDLKRGTVEHNDVGYTQLDLASDWPSPRTVIRAARLLAAAEVRGIH